MDVSKVVEELKAKYPGSNIVQMPLDNPTEIVCEIHPQKGFAIAIVDKSAPHFHKVTKERYKVLRGMLTVFLDGKPTTLNVGEELIIQPGVVHYAMGDETWLEVVSDPPWTPEDHLLIK